MMTEKIALKGLTKRFGPLLAVDDISMSIASGEVLGFLGPNGAGKSTLLKIMAGQDPEFTGEAWAAEGRGSYETFIRTLLSVTDNKFLVTEKCCCFGGDHFRIFQCGYSVFTRPPVKYFLYGDKPCCRTIGSRAICSSAKPNRIGCGTTGNNEAD